VNIKTEGESTMKTRISLLLAVVLMVLLLVVPASAAPPKTEFTSMVSLIATVREGDFTFPDDNIFHARNRVEKFKEVATDPRLSGESLYTINANFRVMSDGGFTGPMWGTFRLDSENGYWEGSWTGYVEEDGSSHYHIIGHGRGGFEGLEFKMDGESPSASELEYYTGVIIETGGG
jgi:hypothetical protein